MKSVIKYTPILLLAIIILSIAMYENDGWWLSVYPYVLQLYPAIMLTALLGYSIKERHPMYLRIIYIGLIDINLLNCIVRYFKVDNWLPYGATIILLTLLISVLFYIFKSRKKI